MISGKLSASLLLLGGLIAYGVYKWIKFSRKYNAEAAERMKHLLRAAADSLQGIMPDETINWIKAFLSTPECPTLSKKILGVVIEEMESRSIDTKIIYQFKLHVAKGLYDNLQEQCRPRM